MHYTMAYIVQNMTTKHVLSRNVSYQYSSEDVANEGVALATFQRTNLVLVIIAQVTRQSGAESGIRAVDNLHVFFQSDHSRRRRASPRRVGLISVCPNGTKNFLMSTQ